jgi:hypothetical protein
MFILFKENKYPRSKNDIIFLYLMNPLIPISGFTAGYIKIIKKANSIKIYFDHQYVYNFSIK